MFALVLVFVPFTFVVVAPLIDVVVFGANAIVVARLFVLSWRFAVIIGGVGVVGY